MIHTGTYINDTTGELLEESTVTDYQSASKTMGYLSADAKLRGVCLNNSMLQEKVDTENFFL